MAQAEKDQLVTEDARKVEEAKAKAAAETNSNTVPDLNKQLEADELTTSQKAAKQSQDARDVAEEHRKELADKEERDRAGKSEPVNDNESFKGGDSPKNIHRNESNSTSKKVVSRGSKSSAGKSNQGSESSSDEEEM